MAEPLKGARVIETLAKRFPQLYVAPAEGAQDAHRLASQRGIPPKEAGLEHFVTSEQDELRMVDTPAGPVEVVFLENREDFETLLQIIGHRSQPVPIARTVGAITYRGLADWQKVEASHLAYLAAGGTDWGVEFARLAKDPQAFRSEIIIVSKGPYSNVPASETPFNDEEWLRVSLEIRLYHECAHVVCRRTMPDDISPLWDEVTADATGLLFATGSYDCTLAARFLGVSASGYTGGRLVEYLDEGQMQDKEKIAADVHASLVRIAAISHDGAAEDPFAFLIRLKREPLLGSLPLAN